MSPTDSSNGHVAVSGTIEEERAKAGFWFSEETAAGLRTDMELKSILHSSHSTFQKVDVIETFFGKTLVTDGKTQSAQFDEFVYHEALVHPSLFKFDDSHKPKTVFIGGGGELATAREVLRHNSVERLVMVDLDEVIIDVSKKYLPEWGNGAQDDPRLDLVIGDAHAYLLNTEENFDLIIMDISDPIEAGPGIALYTQEFYQYAATRLNPGGIFVTQAGIADAIPLPGDPSCIGPIYQTLNSVFDCVLPYFVNIPSFASDWGFVMAFNQTTESGTTTCTADEDISGWGKNVSIDKIDERIASRIKGGEDAIKYYDGETHRGMFILSKAFRKRIAMEDRIMTKENPIFMY